MPRSLINYLYDKILAPWGLLLLALAVLVNLGALFMLAPEFKKLDDMTFIFEGKTMIYDVCKIMNLALDTFDKVKGDSDSLAGLVLEIAGEIPPPNEVILSGDFEFTVLEIVKNRLQKIQIAIKTIK